MSRRQLREGIEALRQPGGFVDGVFTWHDAAGKKHNQDSYEAVWEHVHGRPIGYPQPQYDAPILLRPERFAWRQLPSEPGVDRRHLGAFNDHGLGLSTWRVQGGATWTLPADASARLVALSPGLWLGLAGIQRRMARQAVDHLGRSARRKTSIQRH